MGRPNPICSIMATPLPSITYQRRKCFRPKHSEVIYAYNVLNKHIFDNQLVCPSIQLGSMRKVMGLCYWEQEQQETGSHCRIRLYDKWFCVQWFMNTLAHEMIHQYQWDITHWHKGEHVYEYSGAHGPSFYQWRDRFEHYGLTLKIGFGQKRWFKHQDFKKC